MCTCRAAASVPMTTAVITPPVMATHPTASSLPRTRCRPHARVEGWKGHGVQHATWGALVGQAARGDWNAEGSAKCLLRNSTGYP